MGINAVITQHGVAQTNALKKQPKATEQKEVSFWSKDWTAGNFVRDNIGWDGLADWLDDSDKVCTDGQDDGKLDFGEKMESFGKGLMGLIKEAANHPIATAVTIGVGVGAIALTGGAILPVMIAAGATIGTGMVGIGAYKAATADTDAEAKQAWETIGTGTFALGTSVLGAKSSLKLANKAGVELKYQIGNPVIDLMQNFELIPQALKVSKANALTQLTGVIHPNSINAKINTKNFISNDGAELSQRFVPEGTKYKGANGTVTLDTDAALIVDNNGKLSHISYKDLLNKYNLTEKHTTGIPKEDVVNMIFEYITKESKLNLRSSQHNHALWTRFDRSNLEASVKIDLLRKHNVKLVYGDNTYKGPDPLVGYEINGNLYEAPKIQCQWKEYPLKALDEILEQVYTGKFPAKTMTEEALNKWSTSDIYYK